ncbi:MAG: DUF4962 domain-containing protein [Armatimonadetes bacterium]|nr:DUF4962 domain-containing protein [Armatimonadota bacterium]
MTICRRNIITTGMTGLMASWLLWACSGPGLAGESSVPDRYRLEPFPKLLAAQRGTHPRLYLTNSRIQSLRAAIRTTHANLWKQVRSRADRATASGPPAYTLHDAYSGDEQLWQRDVGNAMPYLAMAWALTGDPKYLESARRWAMASCLYETWGLGEIDGMDLAAGHQLFGLAIVYDWCYEGLGEETRQVIRSALMKRASAMLEAAAAGRIWWHESYLQNHLWVNICGMAAAGLAIFDEEPEAVRWIALPLEKFRKTMDSLGEDGASHEGVGYWGYGVEYMLKFMDLARSMLGVDLYNRSWWRNTAFYRLYMALPRHAWTPYNSIVDIADCPRSNWYGPDYLLRALAREWRDEHAQWLARQVEEAHAASPQAEWLNLIWFDPTVVPKSPDDLPALRHFRDMGLVSVRSGWSGGESMAVFKCGPFIGHKAVRAFSSDPGGGHVHPDANHFVLFGEGEWLLRDDGYRAKWTGQHNTLLIDGKGQTGEGRMWFDGAPMLKQARQPRIIRAVPTPAMDHIIGDAGAAYPTALGLQRFVRHLLFLKPDVLIVVDDIAMNRSAALELRFHPEQTQAQRDGNAFLMTGDKALLRIDPLTSDGVDCAAGEIEGQGRAGEQEFRMFTVRLRAERQTWRNATAISWSKSDARPVKVILRAEDNRWVFRAGNRTAILNWRSGKADFHLASPGKN